MMDSYPCDFDWEGYVDEIKWVEEAFIVEYSEGRLQQAF